MRSLLVILLFPIFIRAQINPVFVYKSDISYSKLEVSGDGMFGFEKDDKFGYADRNGNIVIPAIYSYSSQFKVIPSFSKEYAVVKKDNNFGLIDKTGKVIIPFEYNEMNFVFSNPPNIWAKKQVNNKPVYGIITVQNKITIPFEYESVYMDSNLIGIKQNGKWGLMDITGKTLLPIEYTTINPYARDKVCKVEKDGKLGFIDLKGNWLFEKVKSVYTLSDCYQGMIMCKVNDKYGYLDLKGSEAIITKYDYASNFETVGIAKVGKKNSSSSYSYLYGYIDKKGNEIIPLKYESLSSFSNGLLAAKDPETNRYGYLDKTGKWAIKPIYLEALGFDDVGGAWVKMTDGKYHYINKTGKDLGSFNETTYKNFSKDGYALFENNDFPYALLDKMGKVIKRIDDCDAIYSFSDGIAGYKCKSTGKYGFLDLNGNKIISCEYDSFNGFVEGIAKVTKTIDSKTKQGYIDNKGNIILPIVYENAQNFRDGWGIIKKDSNYFFIDKPGNLKETPRKYDELTEFRSGYALGKVKGTDNNPHTYYYINTQLKEEFSIKAYQAYLFWEDVAVVNSDNKTYQLLNKKGEIFKTLTGVEMLKFTSDGMLAIKVNSKWGFMNQKGDYVINPKYDDCESFKYGYAKVKMGSKWGVIDKSGTEIFEPKYENIVPGENGIFVFYNNAWGVMDKTGKVIVEPTLYTITPFEKDRALGRLGKTFTILKSPLMK